MLTYEQICQLDGDDLNEAVARADGWEKRLDKEYNTWIWEKVNEIWQMILPDYRSGDLLDRIALECRCQIVKDFDFENEKLTAYVAIIGNKGFQSQSLTTAILRAYLWYRQVTK